MREAIVPRDTASEQAASQQDAACAVDAAASLMKPWLSGDMDWMALFTEGGTYWVPAVPDQRNPLDQASLFYDDRELMRTRIDRLEHPRIHVQTPPSRTAHLVGNVLVESADEDKGEYVVGSTVIMVEYRDEQQRVFAGRQHHRLRRDGASFRIVQKRVDLINCDSAFEAMAVPI